jgi:glucan-binding YG repeat protein
LGTSAVPGGWIYQGDYGTMYWYWQKIDGSWYYFQPYNYLGQRIENPSFNPEENRPAYFLMATGWCRPVGESSWYYLGSSGAMRTGWVNDSGTWYWLTGSGAMATGWQQIGSSWCCFAASGAMLHDCWMGRYYLGSSGAMMVDAWTPDGYYVGSDGAWTPGIG